MSAIRSLAVAPLLAALSLGQLCTAPPILAAPPVATMVADIAASVPDPRDPMLDFYRAPRTLPATLGSFAYFFGDDGVHGRELWRTDGSASGTRMIADLCPGRCSSGTHAVFSVARAGTRIFFSADDGLHGEELWTIGPPPSTPTLLSDIVPGARGSAPSYFQVVGDRVFFLARDPHEGYRLWVSDGTAAGTHLVADLVPGPDSFYYQATADLNGVLVFGAELPLSGLWRSDGTPAGTFQISTTVPWQNSWPAGAPFVVLGSKLLFYGQGTQGGNPTLWVSDGTEQGTTELAPVLGPWGFTVCGDDLYFIGEPMPGGSLGVWRTRGTPESTLEVELPPGLRPSTAFGWQACAGSKFAFVATDDEHGSEPWIVEGSSGELLLDIRPGPESSFYLQPEDYWNGSGAFLSSLGGQVLLLADDGIHGIEPWLSDGTAAGTQLILDSIPGGASFRPTATSRVLPRALLGNALLYFERAADWTLRLWKSDGTATGTEPVAVLEDQTSSIPPPLEGLSIFGPPLPSCMSGFGDGLLFAADDAQTGRELWFVSTVTGLVSQIADHSPGAAGSSPTGCHAIGDRSVFSALSDPINSVSELLAVDAQSHQAEILATGTGAVGGEASAARIDDRLILALDSVWRTTGIEAETENLGTFQSLPIEVVAVGQRLFSAAEHLFLHNPETPGFDSLTGEGTDFTYPARLTPLGGDLLFFAGAPETGFEPWRSDGTPEGTLLLADVRPGPGSSIVEEAYATGRPFLTRLVPLGSIALFAADDGVHGEELWRTDGTAAGTEMVRDLFPGVYPSSPRELTRVGDHVFFTAESADAGRELWMSNGFSGLTRRVADLVPGAGSSVPQELAAIRDELWFSAWTPELGREPWRLRRGAGNDVVAERLGDLAPGPLSSSPLIFENAGADVFTVANDNLHGFELWKIRDPDLLFADDFESSGLALWAPAAP